uniref:ShKT domain-containing protein n=1 Tax=Heligmosomoides polygyrus TaxID=6339 RepID=A0A183FS38_HELPZ
LWVHSLTPKILFPATECKDFMEHCETLQCDHVDYADFARANCAKTCNFCFENSTLPPEYACTDLLDDCHDRANLCRDMDFINIMAVFCPRTCMLCTQAVPAGQSNSTLCSSFICATRKNFCTSTNTSAYQKALGCGKTCMASPSSTISGLSGELSTSNCWTLFAVVVV